MSKISKTQEQLNTLFNAVNALATKLDAMAQPAAAALAKQPEVEQAAVAVMAGLTVEQVKQAMDTYSYKDVQAIYSHIQTMFRTRKDQFTKDKAVMEQQDEQARAKQEAETLKKQADKAGGALYAVVKPNGKLSKTKGTLQEITEWMSAFGEGYKAKCRVVAVNH